jgi:exonuclease III
MNESTTTNSTVGNYIKDNSSDLLSIGCLNARSIRQKTASIGDIIATESLDVFAITETWHESSDDIALKRITPDGFLNIDQARGTPPSGKKLTRGGGIALIFKNVFKSRRLDLDFKGNSFEHLTVMLTVHGKQIIFATIYRPGSEPVRNIFFADFSRYMELLAVYNCHVVVLGDINIHLDILGDDHTVKFNNILDFSSQYIIQHILVGTHWILLPQDLINRCLHN